MSKSKKLSNIKTDFKSNSNPMKSESKPLKAHNKEFYFYMKYLTISQKHLQQRGFIV